MYIDWRKDKFYFFWILGTTIGLLAGNIAGFLFFVFIYDAPSLAILKVLGNFLSSAIAGIILGFCQSLPLKKLLKQKGSSRNIRQVIIKWILGTTIGFSVGGSITSLWINLIGSTSAQILIFQIALIIIFIGLGQGLIIKWSTKELFQWLLAHIISILASLLIGLLLYFLSISIGVSITGSGLGAIFFILIIAPLLIILSTGIIYGCVTLYCLSSFLDQNKFE